jgi:hypothetical protein
MPFSSITYYCLLLSGPVTAGVLRGEKGRFQLFGDTMNTASRMESTGDRNKIQISRETTELLIAYGKEKWVTERKDRVIAKGKGEISTWVSVALKLAEYHFLDRLYRLISFPFRYYPQWLNLHTDSSESGSVNALSNSGSHASNPNAQQSSRPKPSLNRVVEANNGYDESGLSKKTMRLVNWNVDILAKILKNILARRASSHIKGLSNEKLKNLTFKNSDLFQEVKDVISLPKFDATTFQNHVAPNSIELSPAVFQQLTDYVTRVAGFYNDVNPFHNFEHASHVTMSVSENKKEEKQYVEVHDTSFPF